MTQALVVNSASKSTLSSPAKSAPATATNCNVTGVAASSSTSPLSGDCGSSLSMLSKLSVSESSVTRLIATVNANVHCHKPAATQMEKRWSWIARLANTTAPQPVPGVHPGVAACKTRRLSEERGPPPLTRRLRSWVPLAELAATWPTPIIVDDTLHSTQLGTSGGTDSFRGTGGFSNGLFTLFPFLVKETPSTCIPHSAGRERNLWSIAFHNWEVENHAVGSHK